MPKYHVLYQEIVTKYTQLSAKNEEEAAALAIQDKGSWLRLPETTGHRVVAVFDSSSTPPLTGNEVYHAIVEPD